MERKYKHIIIARYEEIIYPCLDEDGIDEGSKIITIMDISERVAIFLRSLRMMNEDFSCYAIELIEDVLKSMFQEKSSFSSDGDWINVVKKHEKFSLKFGKNRNLHAGDTLVCKVYVSDRIIKMLEALNMLESKLFNEFLDFVGDVVRRVDESGM